MGPLADLTQLLQHAHAGERAAALAYRGHWRSTSDVAVRERIRSIEAEEWHHRELVGGMLKTIGGRPVRVRELRALIIGRALGLLCRISGALLPAYAAGKLESRNIREYEVGARIAVAAGCSEYVDCMLTMAEVEWEHERFFRELVQAHWLGRRLPLWPAPPALSTIRESFLKEGESQAP